MLSLFELAWCEARKIQTPLESMSVGQLDQNLRRFYAEARTQKRDTYSRSSLLGGRSSSVTSTLLNRNIHISNDPKFSRSNQMLDASW